MKLNKVNIFIILFLTFTTIAISQENYCLEFDGINDYVTMEDVNDLGISDFTIEAWVFIDNPNPFGSKIINKGLTNDGSPSNAGYSLRANKTAVDEIEFAIGNSDGSIKRVLYNGIILNTWYHVAGVREGKKLYLYLNGELVQEDSTETIYNVDTNIPLAIGVLDRGSFGSTSEFLDGRIDEVRIWNTIKSNEEIQSNKDCALTMPLPGLIAVYNLNDSTGFISADSSGFENNGFFGGQPQWINSEVAPICLVNNTNEIDIERINFSPNPATSQINVSKIFLGLDFEIFDISGKVIYQNKVSSDIIDIKHLTNGIYAIKIVNKKVQYIGKLVKI